MRLQREVRLFFLDEIERPLAESQGDVDSMAKMMGPAVFLAQFLRDEPPFNTLENIGSWFAGLGYKGVQIPAWDPRTIDLDQAAKSKTYCDDYVGKLGQLGLVPTEVAGYLQGQVLAVHPAYETMFESFPSSRSSWR